MTKMHYSMDFSPKLITYKTVKLLAHNQLKGSASIDNYLNCQI